MKTGAQARWAAVLLAIAVCLAAPARGKDEAPPLPVDADRWVEIDLQRFERGEIQRSARAFWERFAPLFESVSGTRGVILNVGWPLDPVLNWGGDLEVPIPSPSLLVAEGGGPAVPWTYAELARLAEVLRQTADRRFGLEGVKVGFFVRGRESNRMGARTRFATRHPEAFRPDAHGGRVFDPGARLEADIRRYGAYPAGVSDGLTAGELFGAQWGSLSRAVGLDALVLRDGMLLAGGRPPSGPSASDPAAAGARSRAAADLVRYTKEANPRTLVMGYSTAASAIADWRVDLVDLEAIARAGDLDAFIDVAPVSPDRLAHVLLRGAILSGTPTRHYVLTELFSSESPENLGRLRWGIWAGHHAAVRRPGGLEMPAGTFVSSGPPGSPLPPEEDVLVLKDTLDDAIRDARATREVYGPTLVYNRAASEWLMRTDPDRDIGGEIDDVAGAVMRWPVPILSAARLEDLSRLDLELPILQTPVQLGDRERAAVLDRMAAGGPLAIVGSPAGGIDGDVARAAGLESADPGRGAPRRLGTVLTPVAGLTDGLPEIFDISQPFARNVAGSTATVVHAVEGSPTLVLSLDDGRRTLVWDPPDPADEASGGEAAPWVTVARALSLWLRGGEGPWAELIEPDQPLSLAAWRLADGSRRLLVGTQGLAGPAATPGRLEVSLPPAWKGAGPTELRDVWGETPLALREGRLLVVLEPAESLLVAVE